LVYLLSALLLSGCSPIYIFQAALEHEQKVSASINNLYGLAMKEGDYAAQVMLGDWVRSTRASRRVKPAWVKVHSNGLASCS
jgi:hypothetical protein